MGEAEKFINYNEDKSLTGLVRISSRYKATNIWRGLQKLGYSFKKLLLTQKEIKPQ